MTPSSPAAAVLLPRECVLHVLSFCDVASMGRAASLR